MRILVMLAGLLFGGVAFGLNPHEMPESAHTVGKGNAQVHMGLGQSSYGLSDNVDLRSRLLATYFGFNAQLKWAAIQDEDKALSIEPMVWAESPGPPWALARTRRGPHSILHPCG